eukprot:7956303-Lingulodinium_polyedra.AAC.1
MLGCCLAAAWRLLACCSTRYTDRPPPQIARSRTPHARQKTGTHVQRANVRRARRENGARSI